MGRIVAGILAVFFIVLGTPIAADAAGPRATDVDNFSFDSFAADYYLGVDADGRSTLTTVETLVARFPETDQNRGIRRALVQNYDGHPTDLTVTGVTDESGKPRAFDTESEDDIQYVTIAADDYVHGAQTYVISYEQHNVTRYFDDTGVDEFYWDVNGTGWAQPFGSVTARVHVDEQIADRLTGDAACYWGPEGASNRCEITAAGTDGTTLTASQQNLAAFENVTIAVAFEAGTFVPRDNAYFASPFSWVQLVGLLAALIAGVWGFVIRATTTRDADGRPTIIAEYVPPKWHDLLASAEILGQSGRGTAAALIDLAVRRKIRIIENENRLGKDSFTIELVDPEGLSPRTQQLLNAFFGTRLRPGEQYQLSAKNPKVGKRVHEVTVTVRKDATRLGLRRTVAARNVILPFLLALVGLIAAFVAGVIMTVDARGGAWPLLLVLPAIAALTLVSIAIFRRPLTAAGAELRDYLRGMELYIKVAEQGRLRMLQSPEGAERVHVDVTDRRAMLKLNERMLPYAVLFGQEKEWAEELTHWYDEQPDWYVSNQPFNAAVFVAGVGGLSSSASTVYSGSSTSGGSSGGGSSGGGGGGGGGGGV
ncbi:DUF2207 domain-containing protein [Salinibacterium sp. ZJ454]|uniref:DUF2207 domain-containing protein n=1 Tax=Salinibacterium sp. ZJ454 TaxID=2708339 RepID=UPI00141E869C|nr:DUF2207 domain-containing protein [Salinibacterium sp. ZJ454]